MRFSVSIACCGGLLLGAASSALAQTAPVLPYNIGDAVRQSEEARRAAPQPQGYGAPVLPRLVEPQFNMKDNETLLVRRFKLEGPRLIDEADVREILAPYENRKLTLAKIYEAADKLTTLYRLKGYLVAKVYVPAQNAQGGTLRIKLVPGKYGAVAIKNDSLVRDWFLQGVVDHARADSPYIHKDELERGMLLMSDLPGAAMPRVAIGRGQQPETSDFVFGVPEARRFDGYLLGDNYGSPFTGRDRLSGGFNVNSPFGVGDRFSAFGIVSAHAALVNGRVAYSAPIGYDGLRGEIAAYRTTYALGGVYSVLDSTGTADVITGTLSYALRRTRDDSIVLSGNVAHKALNDNVLGVSVAYRRMDLATVAVTRDMVGAFAGLPLLTSTTFGVSSGRLDFPDAAQRAANIAGVDTVGDFAKLNLFFNATLAFNDRLSLTTNLKAQKSLTGNLDSSEQIGLTGYWGVRSFDEGLAGDSGYVVTPELKYGLPDFYAYRHAVGLFTDVGAVWLADPSFTVTQKRYTELNDIGLGYYATYEYLPGRALLLKAQVVHTYGSNDGAQIYDKVTKGLLQIGSTF
jgi:hemolysin activation/secretion protein